MREDDEDVLIVLNRASRKLEVQPDLARKVIGETIAHTTIPADFYALEAAVNTGSPAAWRTASCAARSSRCRRARRRCPHADEPERPRDDEPRGLIARLGGERGQGTAEFMGLLPVLAARLPRALADRRCSATPTCSPATRRARARASSPSTRATPSRRSRRTATRAEEDLPKAWREDAKIEIDKATVTVYVRLKVPIVLPGLDSRR